MLTNLKISKFRGINSLSLDDFAKVNVILGANGSGKSSILDAIYLISCPTNPTLAYNLGEWREQTKIGTSDLISSLFYQRDLSVGPQFEFTYDQNNFSLNISNQSDFHAVQQARSMHSPDISFSSPENRGLCFTFQVQETGQIYINRLMQAAPIPLTFVDPSMPYENSIFSIYTHGRRATSVGETAHLLTYLSENYRSNELVEIIRTIDNRVTGIEVGSRHNEPTVLVDIGEPKKLPINILGDGFCRMTLIATCLLYENVKIVEIDEIDSGLHASVMIPFWQKMVAAAVAQKKQLFCTTHNEEMLLATLAAFKDNPEDLRIFRIDRLASGELVATKYTYETFSRSNEMGLDIR